MLVLRPADPQARSLSKGLEGWQTLPLRGPATR
jgi:hypothetical protein